STHRGNHHDGLRLTHRIHNARGLINLSGGTNGCAAEFDDNHCGESALKGRSIIVYDLSCLKQFPAKRVRLEPWSGDRTSDPLAAFGGVSLSRGGGYLFSPLKKGETTP